MMKLRNLDSLRVAEAIGSAADFLLQAMHGGVPPCCGGELVIETPLGERFKARAVTCRLSASKGEVVVRLGAVPIARLVVRLFPDGVVKTRAQVTDAAHGLRAWRRDDAELVAAVTAITEAAHWQSGRCRRDADRERAAAFMRNTRNYKLQGGKQ